MYGVSGRSTLGRWCARAAYASASLVQQCSALEGQLSRADDRHVAAGIGLRVSHACAMQHERFGAPRADFRIMPCGMKARQLSSGRFAARRCAAIDNPYGPLPMIAASNPTSRLLLACQREAAISVLGTSPKPAHAGLVSVGVQGRKRSTQRKNPSTSLAFGCSDPRGGRKLHGERQAGDPGARLGGAARGSPISAR